MNATLTVNSKLLIAKLLIAKLVLLLPVVLSTASLGSTIFSDLWGVILGLFKDIAAAMGNLISMSFSGFGQSIVQMFQAFGFSMSSYGVWAPLMFVVGLALAIAVGYLFFDMIDAEKDVTGVEDDL